MKKDLWVEVDAVMFLALAVVPGALGVLLEKGQSHKYLRKVRVNGKWRYYYSLTAGGGHSNIEHIKVGSAFYLPHDGEDGDGHVHVIGVSGDRVKIRHDESGKVELVKKKDLQKRLKMLAEKGVDRKVRGANMSHRGWAAARKEMREQLLEVYEHGSAKQKARLEARAQKFGVDIKAMRSKYQSSLDVTSKGGEASTSETEAQGSLLGGGNEPAKDRHVDGPYLPSGRGDGRKMLQGVARIHSFFPGLFQKLKSEGRKYNDAGMFKEAQQKVFGPLFGLGWRFGVNKSTSLFTPRRDVRVESTPASKKKKGAVQTVHFEEGKESVAYHPTFNAAIKHAQTLSDRLKKESKSKVSSGKIGGDLDHFKDRLKKLKKDRASKADIRDAEWLVEDHSRFQ